MEKENLFRIFWGYVWHYFTLRTARKVFFFALCAVVVFALIVNVAGNPFTFQLLLSACVVAALATLFDSLCARREFVAYMNHIKAGSDGFSNHEAIYVKKKKRSYNYEIVIKAVFFLIFLVFLIQGV